MKILGIHDGPNAAACLVEDGHIVAAHQDERMRGLKNWAGFHLEGYPLVESPARDALDVFNRSGLTHLAIGRLLVTRSL